MDTKSLPDFVSGKKHPPAAVRAKSRKDVDALKQYARFVIDIKDDGLSFELIDNEHLILSKKPFAPLIVVVGNVIDEDNVIFPASLLEIGYRRARPYRRVHTRNEPFLWQRYSETQLTDNQIRLVYPQILKCLEVVLIETRERWKTQESWWADGGRHCVERGVQITINKSDRWLYRQFLKENVRYYTACWFPRYLRWINRRLKHTNYPPKYLGKSVKGAIESILGSRYARSPLLLEALLHGIPKRKLVEHGLIVLSELDQVWDEETEMVFGSGHWLKLPRSQHFFFWQTLDQPKEEERTHAQGCVRFEVVFDRREEPRAVSAHAVMRQVKMILNKGGTDDPDDPDHCPF